MDEELTCSGWLVRLRDMQRHLVIAENPLGLVLRLSDANLREGGQLNLVSGYAATVAKKSGLCTDAAYA